MSAILQGDHAINSRPPKPVELERSTGVQHPLVLVNAMIERGADPDALKKMMDLAERFEANQAAKAFADALAGFQGQCPMVFKHRQGDRYKFASLDDVMLVAKPILSQFGICTSYSVPKGSEDGWFEIVVHIRVGTHSESRPFAVPAKDMEKILNGIADKQRINVAQAFGSWLQYQKRYAFCAALGITVAHEDNDCQSEPGASPEQLAEIAALVEERKRLGRPLNEKPFLEWLGVKAFTDLDQTGCAKAVQELRRSIHVLKAAAEKGGAE